MSIRCALENLEIYYNNLFCKLDTIYFNEVGEYVITLNDGMKYCFLRDYDIKLHSINYNNSDELDQFEYNKEFGRRLFSLMVYKNVSSLALSRDISISYTTLRRVLNGEISIRTDYLRKILAVLDYSDASIVRWKY